MSQDMVLKLSQHSQQQELTLAKLLPGIASPVYWVEGVMVVLHDDKGDLHNLVMTLLCQQPVVKAVEVMEARGPLFSFKFLCHVGCALNPSPQTPKPQKIFTNEGLWVTSPNPKPS